MTIFYPDISSFQAGFAATGIPALCVKATEGTTYTNPDYLAAKARAAAAGTFFFAYHFLRAGNGAAQADHCFSVTGQVPVMVDVESEVLNSGSANPRSELFHAAPAMPGQLTTTSTPTVSDVVAFITQFRKRGGTVYLNYIPHWYWGNLGSPSLAPLKALGQQLVSSDYTAYSDTGPGWAGYGGMAPVVWQYSDNTSKNGHVVDYNAYKGTVAEFKSIVTGGEMDLTKENLSDIAKAVWQTDGIIPSPIPGAVNKFWTGASHLQDSGSQIRSLEDQVKALVAALAKQEDTDTAAIIAGVLQGLSTADQADVLATAIGTELAQELAAALQSLASNAAAPGRHTK